jgi:NAD(P)-dependent dehydrogenase (short-subunit alcohol dehydrogenase family)
MMPAEFDVTGKVVFITGAGRGIGKGIAQVLAEAGADIALNALTPRYVEGTAAGSRRRPDDESSRSSPT